MRSRSLKFILTLLGAAMMLALVPASVSLAHPARDIRGLLAKAQTQGSVRVIVGVRANFTPEGGLPTAAAQTQRAQIAQAQDALLTQMPTSSVRASHKFEFIPFLVLETDTPGLAFLASAANVTSLEEDQLRRPIDAESTPLVGATNAWASGYSGSGWTVAILDTGVDKTHPFLAGKVVSEACYSSTYSAQNIFSVCPGGVTSSTAVGSGVNCNSLVYGCDHGTHVAGIAAGKDYAGGPGFSGIARDANIIAIQVFSRFDNASDCAGLPTPCALSYDSDQISALQRVYVLRAVYNISSVNLSLGGWQYFSNCDVDLSAYKSAVDTLRSVGIATVIASGNSGYTDSISAPACISSAISVGSTTDGGSSASPADLVSSFSNSASFLNLLAPGQYINSSVPGGGYGNWAGTSMATPHVTGAWAVLKSRKPSATVDQVLNALTSSGVAVTDSRNGITKPRIQIDAAMNVLVPPTPPIPSKNYLPFIGTGLGGVPGNWVTVLNTTYEGDFPGSWWVVDADGVTNGEYDWGARNCRAYSGSSSGWAVGAGADGGLLPCGSNYPNNAQSWMIYGPFDLSNTSAAELRARIWTQTEVGFDTLCMLASSGGNYYGTCYSGTFNWEAKVLDLSNVNLLGNLLGQSNVSVALRFYSDYSNVYAEGAYVDDIVLRTCASGTICPASPVSTSASGNRGVAKPATFPRPK